MAVHAQHVCVWTTVYDRQPCDCVSISSSHRPLVDVVVLWSAAAYSSQPASAACRPRCVRPPCVLSIIGYL